MVLIRIFAWLIVGVGTVIIIGFLYSIYQDSYSIFSKYEINFGVTGQVGDFVGGVVGTLFSLAGTLLIILSFNEQNKQNKRETFESSFFEMIRLQRENVSELTYTIFKNDPLIEEGKGNMVTAHNRKVFRIIFKEFQECYREINKYSRFMNQDDIIEPEHLMYLNEIKIHNKLKVELKEMALIDIAYSVLYYGINSEGMSIIRHNFLRKYKTHFIYRLLYFIHLKPKKQYSNLFEHWTQLRSLESKELTSQIDYTYINRDDLKNGVVLLNMKSCTKYLVEHNYSKYYGGHQHRLGHYFRNLFQAYKYLDNSNFLTSREKYFYGKILRAQLSTYEQSLLFVNSISSLGMTWELVAEVENHSKRNFHTIKRNNFITQYNLIKNLPGNQIDSIRYRKYYPNVNYESEK